MWYGSLRLTEIRPRAGRPGSSGLDPESGGIVTQPASPSILFLTAGHRGPPKRIFRSNLLPGGRKQLGGRSIGLYFVEYRAENKFAFVSRWRTSWRRCGHRGDHGRSLVPRRLAGGHLPLRDQCSFRSPGGSTIGLAALLVATPSRSGAFRSRVARDDLHHECSSGGRWPRFRYDQAMAHTRLGWGLFRSRPDNRAERGLCFASVGWATVRRPALLPA